MNIDKAIELLYEYRHIDDHLCIEDINASIDLSIEALKVVEGWRNLHPSIGQPLLPGETEGADNEPR